MSVLARGGNAFDAAVAAGFVLQAAIDAPARHSVSAAARSPGWAPP